MILCPLCNAEIDATEVYLWSYYCSKCDKDFDIETNIDLDQLVTNGLNVTFGGYNEEKSDISGF